MNLDKENFWNPLKEKYPEAIEHFCNWIDEYKKEVGWNQLFGEHIKFHDLPYDMQNGILARFDLEKFNGKNQAQVIMQMEPKRIVNLFADVQKAIKNRSIKYN
jgi:hypothetical protein